VLSHVDHIEVRNKKEINDKNHNIIFLLTFYCGKFYKKKSEHVYVKLCIMESMVIRTLYEVSLR